MAMVFQWCGPCWIDGDRSPAIVTLDGLPLCKPCSGVFADDKESLERVKKEWEAMPEMDDRASPVPNPALKELCECGKPKGHPARCRGWATRHDAKPEPQIQRGPPVKHIPIPVGGFQVRLMKTSEYVAQYGSFRSKGMKRETQELWERLMAMSVGDCMVITVPQGQSAFKLRASLSNTIQRLIRLNKAPFKIGIGANSLKGLVCIAKEQLTETQ